MIRAEIFENAAQVESLQPAWDELARAAGRPFCSPAWMLAWWRHARPERARLRIVGVFDDDDLIGVSPLFTIKKRTGVDEARFLGSRTSVRGEPVASEGREQDVARATVKILDSTKPRIDLVLFEGVPTTSQWPALLHQAWSAAGEPYKHRAYPTLAPTLDLTGRDYEQWFMSRPSHFRQEVRRRRRHLEQRGAEFHLAEGPEEVVNALDAFFRLHHSRWQERGGSRVLNERVQAMLVDAALQLVDEMRFRIWTIAAGSQIVSAHIFIAAGGEVAYWLGGFDEDWAKLGPAIQTVLKALEHAWALGDKRMDFGAGAQEYKYSFAEGQDVLESVMIAPRNVRYPLTRVQLLSRLVRETASTRMNPELRERLNRLRQRA